MEEQRLREQSTGDRDLARRIRSKDAEAMAELYDRDGALIYTILLRIVRNPGVAEDLTQEVFLRVWNSIQSFKEERGSLKTWVAVMARNRAVDYMRSPHGRLDRSTCELSEAIAPQHALQSEKARATEDLMRASCDAIKQLGTREQEVIRLAYFEGMTQVEIAKQIKVPLGTVKTWVRAALTNLRKQVLAQPETIPTCQAASC
jgi:RNA polymerase sigma-70 factor, ECF subfamily